MTPTETIGSGAFGTVYKANLTSEKGFSYWWPSRSCSRPRRTEMFIKRMRDEGFLGLLQDDQFSRY